MTLPDILRLLTLHKPITKDEKRWDKLIREPECKHIEEFCYSGGYIVYRCKYCHKIMRIEPYKGL